MISYSTLKEDLETSAIEEVVVSDFEALTADNLLAEEIISLIELRQRYQSGGSDRAQVIHHWEFLRLLVANGKMEA